MVRTISHTLVVASQNICRKQRIGSDLTISILPQVGIRMVINLRSFGCTGSRLDVLGRNDDIVFEALPHNEGLVSYLRSRFNEGLKPGVLHQIFEAIEGFVDSMPKKKELSHIHDSSDFQLIKSLGRGGFGSVFLCKGILDEKEYAIKQVYFSASERDDVVREVQILCTLDHRNIVRYFQSWVCYGLEEFGPWESGSDGSLLSGSDELPLSEVSEEKANLSLYVVMEYCPMTLRCVIEEDLDQTTALKLFKQLMEAVAHIHEKGIIHRDISRDNVFVDACGNVKLGDFGIARKLGDAVRKVEGNWTYLAPEAQRSPPLVSEKVDIFSSGLILLEMLHPIKTDAERSYVFNSAKQGILPDNVANQLTFVKNLIGDMLHQEVDVRPTARAALSRLPC